jgi:hypothetical protein
VVDEVVVETGAEVGEIHRAVFAVDSAVAEVDIEAEAETETVAGALAAVQDLVDIEHTVESGSEPGSVAAEVGPEAAVVLVVDFGTGFDVVAGIAIVVGHGVIAGTVVPAEPAVESAGSALVSAERLVKAADSAEFGLAGFHTRYAEIEFGNEVGDAGNLVAVLLVEQVAYLLVFVSL